MDRQFAVSRVLFCQGIFNWRGAQYYIKPFSRFHKLRAEMIGQELIDKSYDCLSQEEMDDWLIHKGLWDSAREKELRGLEKDVETLKMGMVDMQFKSNEKEITRAALRKAEKEIERLEGIKYQYRYLTKEGMANHFKIQYLVGSALHRMDGGLALKQDFWRRGMHPLLNVAFTSYLENRLNDTHIRELARNDPWLAIWSAAESCGSLFGEPSADLTEEQKSLIMWTRAYENVRSAEDMNDTIINDDDIFDGWLLKQNKKKQGEKDASYVESKLTNPKIAASEHVFIMAETDEDVKRIAAANNKQAQMAKKTLMNDITQSETTAFKDTSEGREKMLAAYMEKQRGLSKRR